VKLIVGALRYPEGEPSRQHANAPDDISDIDLTELTVELDAPIVVSSGRTARGALRIYNKGADPIVICTNGQVTAEVIDPEQWRSLAISLARKLCQATTSALLPARPLLFPSS